MNIYVCGIPGYEAAQKLYSENREFIKARFPEFYLRAFEELKKDLVLNTPTGYFYVRKITEGGIFRALWEAAEDLGCGLAVNTEDIPVRQEVVELMELFGKDPYESSSAGTFLIIDEGENVPSSRGLTKIGETNNKKSRIAAGPFGTRYLTPPSRQEKDIAARGIRIPAKDATADRK